LNPFKRAGPGQNKTLQNCDHDQNSKQHIFLVM